MYATRNGLRVLSLLKTPRRNSIVTANKLYTSKRSISSSKAKCGSGSFFQKNKFIEEWNGTREITEKTWTIDGSNVVSLLVSVVVFPTICYTLMKTELADKYRKEGRDVEQL